ncbi:MAG: PTS sugar transporter subunit IIA [Longimicrobiales bacterium]
MSEPGDGSDAEALSPACGVVVAHGDMAHGLVEAVRQIAGVSEDTLAPVPNQGLGRDGLCAAIRGAFHGGRHVIFTDLPSGSCHLAAMLVAREMSEVAVVTGVNLPMLLDFVFKRGLPLNELVPRLTEKGQNGIDGHRPISS